MNSTNHYFDNISNVIGDEYYLLMDIVKDLLDMFSENNINNLYDLIKKKKIIEATIIIKRLESAALNFNMKDTKKALGIIEKKIYNRKKINLEVEINTINKEIDKIKEMIEVEKSNSIGR
ncbi:hypothetical protein [Dethiothermospora halolimnae]|uniref:hypothetical protein n=1 Tax=Dethiothermospora halolimnae TaxID=3114390 RepID=UPI003CCBFFE7